MKFRKGPVLLLIVALLALGLGGGAMIVHHRAKRAVADYKRELTAAGEKLAVAELTPHPTPLAQNGAAIFFKALTLMNSPAGVFNTNPPAGMLMVTPGKAKVGWAQPDIRSKEATNTWAEAYVDADSLSAALDTLADLIERSVIDFRINYQLGFTAMPNLVQTKRAAQQVYYAMLCDLHRGDAASAALRLRTLLALTQGSADERLVISQLVRIAVTAYAVVATWEFLQSPVVTDQELTQIQNDWSRMEFISPAENALAMERAMGQMTIEQMRNSSTEFRKVASSYSWPAAATSGGSSNWIDQAEQFGKDTWNKNRLLAKETAWRFSWSYTDQLRSLKGEQVLIETARLAGTNGNFSVALARQEQRLRALGIQSIETDDSWGSIPADMDFRTIFSQGVRSLTKFLEKVMKIEASRQLAVTAIALQRYKLHHGHYPQNLAELTPQILPAVPRDPVNGQPLGYRPNANRTFLLYSVGEDCEDDNGDPKPADNHSKSLQWQRGRDWVWPQPATPKEVEDFYREQSK